MEWAVHGFLSKKTLYALAGLKGQTVTAELQVRLCYLLSMKVTLWNAKSFSFGFFLKNKWFPKLQTTAGVWKVSICLFYPDIRAGSDGSAGGRHQREPIGPFLNALC